MTTTRRTKTIKFQMFKKSYFLQQDNLGPNIDTKQNESVEKKLMLGQMDGRSNAIQTSVYRLAWRESVIFFDNALIIMNYLRLNLTQSYLNIVHIAVAENIFSV